MGGGVEPHLQWFYMLSLVTPSVYSELKNVGLDGLSQSSAAIFYRFLS